MRYLLLPVGSHGDVHPFVGLALALKARGQQVLIATNDHFRPLIEKAGIPFHALGEEQSFLDGIKQKAVWSPFRGFYTITRWIAPLHEKTYQLIQTLSAEKPTVVVAATLAWGARVAQEKLGIPTASVHLSPAIFRSLIEPPKLPGLYMPKWFPTWLKERIWMGGDQFLLDPIIRPTLEPLRSNTSYPPALSPARRYMASWIHSPDLVLAMFPQWFAPLQTDWPANTHHCGFPLYDEANVHPLDPALESFLASGPPPVAFTPGSAMTDGARFFAESAKACQRAGLRGLLLTRHAQQIPASLPPGVIHVPYAPFSLLLPRCCASVHHGGVGSTAQALKAGVPQLIMPMSHDQPDNARRVKNLGCGDWVSRPAYKASRVARMLKEITSSQAIKAACKKIAGEFNQLPPGVEIAADLLIHQFATTNKSL